MALSSVRTRRRSAFDSFLRGLAAASRLTASSLALVLSNFFQHHGGTTSVGVKHHGHSGGKMPKNHHQNHTSHRYVQSGHQPHVRPQPQRLQKHIAL